MSLKIAVTFALIGGALAIVCLMTISKDHVNSADREPAPEGASMYVGSSTADPHRVALYRAVIAADEAKN